MKRKFSPKELQKKTEGELDKLLGDLRSDMRQARFKLIRGELKNVHEPRQLRKGIARVLTFLHQSYAKEK